MSEPNFKCPETGEEFFIENYRMMGDGVYTDKYGKELVSKEGVKLEFIERDKGMPTAIFRSGGERIARNQKFFKKRAKKHSNSLDEKIRKQERTKKELKRFINK